MSGSDDDAPVGPVGDSDDDAPVGPPPADSPVAHYDDDDDDDDDEEEEEDGVNPLAALVAGPLADDDDDDEESDGGEYDPTKGRRGRGGADDDDDDADDDIDDPEDDDDGDGDDDDGAKADDDHDEDEDDDDDEGPVRRKKTHAQKKRSRRVIDDDDDDDDDEEEEDVGEGDKDDSYNERKRRHESDGSELDSDDLELIKEAQEKALVQEGRSRKRAKDTEKKQKKKNKKQKTAKTAKLSAFAQQFVESSASVDKGDEDTESGAPPKKKKRRRDDFVADSDEDLEEDDDDALARFEAFDEEMASDEEDLSPPGSDEEEDDEEEGGDSDGDGGTAALLGGKSKKKKKKATGAAAPPASLRVDDEFGDFIEHDGSESEHSEDEEMDDGVRFEVDILKEGQNEALGIFGELYHGLLDGATALDADVEDDFDDGDYDRLNEEDEEIIEEGGDDADAATARMAERQRRREERRKERAIGLEQAYEPAELVRSLMTASDTLIRATDFPERLQSLQKLRQTHTEAHGAGFAEEAEWIYVNGFGGRPKSDDGSRRAARSLHRDVRSFIVDIREGSASGAVKGITNALRLIFQDGFEPAFVATYRVDDLLDLAQSYHSEVLPTEDIMLRLYVMLDWDERFLRLHAGKRRLLQLCDQVRDSLLEAEAYDGADRVVVETTRLALQDDAEEQAHLANGGIEVDHELADMEQRMVFYFADRINTAKKGTGQHQMPAQHTNYRHCLSSGVGAITRHYGIPVHKLGRNILLGKARHEIEESEQDPNDVAEEFVDPTVEMRKSSKRVLAMARYMVAQEIVFDPNIRAAARDSFFDLGSVTVRATAKGLKELDSHHPYSAFAFLTNKHLDEFKDDQFLHILRAEEQGLVNVYVRGERLLAGEDPASPAVASRCPEFVERAFRVYHETELDLWNPERRAALENAIVYGLFPQFAREARMALRKRAELHVLHQCFVDMLKRAMSPPVPRTLLPLRSDFGGDEVAYDAELRDYESSVCGTVAGCFIGDSRTPTFLAFINGNGVMMDFLKLDYLAKGRAAGASKLESDERRLREFIEAKRPSVVAVAANNLSDRRIFDQIAGIVGSVNDLKRHEARERKQEMLDEKREVDAAALKRKKSKKKAGAVTAELNPLDYELQPEDNAGFTPMQVRWADPSVPNIYGQSERSSKEFPQFPPVLCRAISVGRVVQDPLFEYASLSNIDHELTGVKVTPLQSLVGEELVEEWFERALVTAVARVGVDFNHVLRFPHREAALHLVAGFGLRKAQYLARGVQQRRQPIRTRLELRATPGVGECVYRNAAPFLKIVAPAHSHNDDDDMDEYEMEGVDDGDIVYDDDDDDDADDDDDGERRRARRRNQQRQRQRQRGGDEDEGEDDGDGDEIVVPEPLGYTEEEEEYFAVVHNDELDLNDIVENEELVKDADDDEDNVNFVEHQQLLVEKRKRLAEWEERERARIERAEAIEMAQERLRRRRERNEELERAKREKRLIHYVDVLDQTRVPPEAYDYARFIAKNAVESNETADDIRDDPSKHVARLLASRSDDSGAREILRLFDLADMALNYLRQKNVVQLLELIREELRDPFRDPRRRLEDVAGELGAPESRTGNPYASVGAERLLTLFTGETLATLCKGRVVKGTVMRFSQRDKPTTTVRLDCGLQGIIPLSKLSRTRLAHPEERLSIGQVVEARIVELDPARMLAVLECRGDTMANPPPEMAPVRDAIYYDAPAEEAARASARAKKEAQHQAKMRRYKKRPIEHPLFRNVSLAAALALLEDPSVDAVFRPSSKGTDHLTVSWKFAEGEIVHEDIQELDKVNDVVLGRRLRILDEEYEDLDEIVVRRIQPSIAFSKAICGYKYFRSMQQSELKKMMEKEKSQYPSKTPYYFIIDRGHPKCFSLGCLPSRRVRFETVRVTADGYRYRQELHTSLQKLVGYFKRNINVAPPKRPTPAVASAKPQSTNNAMDDVSMGGGSSVGAWSGGGASSGGGGGYGDGSVRRPSRFDVGAPPSGTPSYFSDSYGGRQGAGAGAPPPMHPPPSSYLPPPPQRQQQQQQRPPSSYSTGGGQQYGQGTVGYDPYASQSSFSLPPPPHQYGGPPPPSGALASPPWRSGGAPPPPAPPGWVKEGASSSKPRY